MTTKQTFWRTFALTVAMLLTMPAEDVVITVRLFGDVEIQETSNYLI